MLVLVMHGLSSILFRYTRGIIIAGIHYGSSTVISSRCVIKENERFSGRITFFPDGKVISCQGRFSADIGQPFSALIYFRLHFKDGRFYASASDSYIITYYHEKCLPRASQLFDIELFIHTFIMAKAFCGFIHVTPPSLFLCFEDISLAHIV